MPRVVIEQLRKTFPLTKGRSVCAVNDLNLTVEAGEFLVLVGPSGSGKTTTLRLLAGLEDVTAGTVSIDGRVMNQVPAKDRDLAMVFQHHALYPHMTVYENLAFGLTLRHVPKTEIDRRVQEAARWLDLLPLLTRKPAALSGGQRQRVAVGRAVVRQAGVLLFDEPLSNLDAPLRATLRAEISRLHRRLGTTTIYVTHDQVEAMTLGDRIAVMHEGTLQQIATPMELYARPANVFVARFFGSPPMNLFQGTLRRDGAAWHFAADDSAGKFQLPISHTHTERLARHVGQAVVVGLRPEHFLKPLANNLLPENIQLTATVELVERTGAETHLHLALGTNLFVARVAADEPVKVNQIISLTVDMEKALFFEATTGAVIR